MKKILLIIAALLCFGTNYASAQGLLKKLKQKAESVITKTVVGEEEDEEDDATDDDNDYRDNGGGGGMAAITGNDMVQKRKTATLNWDGTVTPSKASSASALLRELPAMPSAEQMARSTEEQREAYYLKIAAVNARVEQLQGEAVECSDADFEALRTKMEKQISETFGISEADMAKLNDESTSEAEREAISKRAEEAMLKKLTGGGVDMSEIERFEKMSEKEQEQYIREHPDFQQRMMQMAQNAMNMGRQMQNMTAGATDFSTRLAQLTKRYTDGLQKEQGHDYESIAKKYQKKLESIYNQIFETDDQNKVDALYEEADKLLYSYRLEAAKEYRASLNRQMESAKDFAEEYNQIMNDAVKDGTLPACILERNDLNSVTVVANVLESAYSDLPDIGVLPVKTETVLTLPKGYMFMHSESKGYVGGMTNALKGYSTSSTSATSARDLGEGVGCCLPLLVRNYETGDYGVIDCGQFRKINEAELNRINKLIADGKYKQCDEGNAAPYGKYTSRTGKRSAVFGKDGSLVIDGMTTFYPTVLVAQPDKLQWIEVLGTEVVVCTYKL